MRMDTITEPTTHATAAPIPPGDTSIEAGGQVLGLAATGDWLRENRLAMDRGEAVWLAALAGFDRAQGWVLDGQLSGVDWLVLRTGMARATAYEKLQVAHELARRPLVFSALAKGRLSYSAARTICRIEHPDPEVERALVEAAECATVADLERLVRFYKLHADQHRRPPEPGRLRGLRIRRGLDGISTIEITLPEAEVEEVVAALARAVDAARPTADGSAGAEDPIQAVDDSARAERPFPEVRADALMDLLRAGAAHLPDGPAPGADRYMLHVVYRPGGGPELLDGTPVPLGVASALACDCTAVAHRHREGGDIDGGRARRTWSTAQRRVIVVRDRGTCRFPGCRRRVNDIHHVRWWSRGGPTDVDNGLLICPRHHTLLHDGFQARGSANEPVLFLRPDGTPIGWG